MSIHRAAAKADAAQPEIVEAIRAEGWDCYLMRLPCDLLCWHPVLDVWQPMEVKTGRKKSGEARERGAQEAQRKFLHWTAVPVVTTPEEALDALSRHYPPMPAVAPLVDAARKIRADFERDWKTNQSAPGAQQRVSAIQPEAPR